MSAIPKLIGGLIGKIATGFAPLDAVFKALGKIFVDFGRLIQEIFQGDIGGAWEVLKRMFVHMAEYLSALGTLFWTLIKAAAQAIWDALSSVDWMGLGRTLLGHIQTAVLAIGSLTLELAGKAGELIGGLYDWIKNYNWVQLGLDILTWIGDAITAIGSLTDKLTPSGTDLLTGLQTGAVTAWTTFSGWFSQRKDRILDVAKLMFLPYTLYKYGGDIITGIWDGAKAVWGLIDDWFLGLVDVLVANAKLLFLPWVLYEYGDDIIRGIWLGMKWSWGKIDDWFLGLVDLLVDNAKFLFLPWVLYEYGDDIIRGIWLGMKWSWGKIDDWFNTLVDLLVDIAKIIFLPTALYYYGDDVMRGLWNGMKYVWGLVGGWLAGLGRAIVTLLKFIFLPTLIYFYGKDILNGFLDGMKAIWDGVAGVAKWLGGLGGKALTAIGDLSTTLWDTGYNIIWGIKQGMQNYWDNTLWPWVQGLAGEIAGALLGGLKIWSPSRVMRDIGDDIMAGLYVGLTKASPAVLGAVEAVATGIAGTPFGTPAIASVGTAATSNTITINVSGAGDPKAVADEVYTRFSRELGLKGAL